MVTLIKLARSTIKRSTLKLYTMHLVQLTDRTSSIMMVQRACKNGQPLVDRFGKGKKARINDQVAIAFEAYAEASKVVVRPTTAISTLHTMHEDICHVVKQKRVGLIIIPFHKQWREDGNGAEEIKTLGHGWRLVNQRVLEKAPCSVAVLLEAEHDHQKMVCVLFFGGPDDREALELGGRMSKISGVRVRVSVIRLVGKDQMERKTETSQPSAGKCNSESF
ncbi:hypothetical protein Ancab_014710 [Ancistrocladus abbreviatus]